MSKWRIGEHYGIHVYEGDRPVATFHNVDDARRAVDAVNAKVSIAEVVLDPDDAAYIASGRPFRVLDQDWTWRDDGPQIRTIHKIERVDE